MSTQDTAGTAREGMTMSDETTRLRALLERATPRPWHNGGLNGDVVGTVVEDDAGDDVALLSRRSAEGPASEDHEAWANAGLIVAAVNALPALLDAAERAGRELATATASVRQLRADVELATAQRDAEACRADNAEAERDDLAATLETRNAEHALAMARVRELEAIIAGRTTAALVSPQRPRIGDVVAFEGNRCTVTAVDEQRFYAEDHDWQTSIAPDWSEVEFARPVWIARFRGRGPANGSKRGGAR